MTNPGNVKAQCKLLRENSLDWFTRYAGSERECNDVARLCKHFPKLSTALLCSLQAG